MVNDDGEDEDEVVFPGEEESRDEVRRLAVGRVVKRPRRGPERRPAPPSEVRAIREGVEEIADNTELLQLILSRLIDIQDTVIATTEILDPHFDDDYLYVNQTVWPRNSFNLNILDRIGHAEPHGWIKKDTSEGTLNVKINGQREIDFFGEDELETDALMVEDIEFSAPSGAGTQSFRAMFWWFVVSLRGRQRSDLRWATEPVDRVFNKAVSANTDLFSDDLVPSDDASTFRLEIAENTGVVVTVRETVGGATVSMDLNGGTVIDANALNKFDIKTRSDAAYNFRVGTGTTILKFQVDELLAEVA